MFISKKKFGKICDDIDVMKADISWNNARISVLEMCLKDVLDQLHDVIDNNQGIIDTNKIVIDKLEEILKANSLE